MNNIRRKSGFTLVELLLVIAIIALLVALLLPALNKARASALNVKCMSNMRQYVLAAQMYTNDNKGFLPPYWREERATRYYFSDPTNNVPTNGTDTMVDTTTRTTCGGGRLYEMKYLRSDQVYFCPASSDPIRTVSAVPLPLLSDPTNGYETSYHLNPHWTRPTAGAAWSATNRGIAAYPKISQYKSGRALIVEYLYSVATSSHRQGNTHGWNLAFSDGHVATAYSIDAMTSLNAMTNTNNNWRRFDDVRDMLEATATGRNPKANPRTGAVFPTSGWDTYRVHPLAEY